jgi:hypothetical protein
MLVALNIRLQNGHPKAKPMQKYRDHVEHGIPKSNLAGPSKT